MNAANRSRERRRARRELRLARAHETNKMLAQWGHLRVWDWMYDHPRAAFWLLLIPLVGSASAVMPSSLVAFGVSAALVFVYPTLKARRAIAAE